MSNTEEHTNCEKKSAKQNLVIKIPSSNVSCENNTHTAKNTGSNNDGGAANVDKITSDGVDENSCVNELDDKFRRDVASDITQSEPKQKLTIKLDADQNKKDTVSSSAPSKTKRRISAKSIFIPISAMICATLSIMPLFTSLLDTSSLPSQYLSVSLFGPIDELGQRLKAMEPTIGTNDAIPQPFNENAIKAQKRAEIILSQEGNVIGSLSTEELDALAQKKMEEETTRAKAEADEIAQQAEKEARSRADAANEEIRLSEERRAAAQKQAEEAAAEAQRQADYEWSLTHPVPGAYYSTIAIAGETIPLVVNRYAVPETCGGIWKGDNIVDDGLGVYIVGHNPGVFHNLIDLNFSVGDQFTIWDASGNCKVYVIDNVLVVPAGTRYNRDLRAVTIESGGECACIQTCINNNNQYKIFVAH